MSETTGSRGGHPTRSQQDNTPIQGMRLTQDIQLIEKLGAGGMGEVWSASHFSRHSHVAVKFLSPRLRVHEHHVERFQRVIGIVSELQHSHICPLYENGEHAILGPWFVMKLASGTTLDKYSKACLDSTGRIPVSEILEILTQVADALDYIHNPETIHPGTRGVIHCDIKPSNIVITRSPQSRNVSVQIVDFGLAISLTDVDRWSRNQEVLGTNDYMAPEQRHGNRLNCSSDQYSLAVVAYELLGNRMPFSNSVKRHPESAPIRILAMDALHPVFCRALAWKPEDRFGTCTEFVNELRENLQQVQMLQIENDPGITGIRIGTPEFLDQRLQDTQSGDRRKTEQQKKSLEQGIQEKSELLAKAEQEQTDVTNELSSLEDTVRIGMVGTRNAGKSTLFASWYLFRGDRNSKLDISADGETLDYLKQVADDLRRNGTTSATAVGEPSRLQFRVSSEGRLWHVETIDFSGELLNPRMKQDKALAGPTHDFLLSCDLVIFLHDLADTDIDLIDAIDNLFQSPIRDVVLLLTKFDRLGYSGNSNRDFRRWFLSLLDDYPVLSTLFNKIKTSYSQNRLTVVPVSATGCDLNPPDGEKLDVSQLNPFQIFVPLVLGLRRRAERIEAAQSRLQSVNERLEKLRSVLTDLKRRAEVQNERKRTAIEANSSSLSKAEEKYAALLKKTPLPATSLKKLKEQLVTLRTRLRELQQAEMEERANQLMKKVSLSLSNTLPTEINTRLTHLGQQIDQTDVLLFIQQAERLREDLTALKNRCRAASLLEDLVRVEAVTNRFNRRMAKIAVTAFGMLIGIILAFVLVLKLIGLFTSG